MKSDSLLLLASIVVASGCTAVRLPLPANNVRAVVPVTEDQSGEDDQDQSLTPIESESSELREPGSSNWLEVSGNRFRLYGFPRLDLIFADSRLAPNNQFPFFVFSEDPTVQPENDEEFDIHARLTRLGVGIERDSIPAIPTARIDGKIELDFQNGGSESREAVRMRLAYLNIVDRSGFSLLAGQTWDLIAPLNPSVNADSLMWNAGNLGDRRPQLRLGYETAFDDMGGVNFAVAIARWGAINNRDLDGDGTADGVDSGLPMLQARLGVTDFLGGAITGGVWGHYGWEDVDLGVAGEDEFTTNGIGLDLLAEITERLTFSGEVWYGQNLDDVRGGIGQGINTTTGDEITSRGGWGELGYKVSDVYTPAIGYTVDDPIDSDLDPATTSGGGPREKNQAIYFSNRFDLGGGVGVGLEYIYWKTWYQGLDDGDANRVNLWFAYRF